jgi:hypothetical protein
MIAGRTPLNGSINLANLRIMRTGQNIKLELKSTEATTVKVATMREIDTFPTTAAQNATTILWALRGETITMVYGSSLTTGGTITLRYPRVPNLPTANTDMVDLPDGAPIELAIIYLKTLISKRLDIAPDPNDDQRIQTIIASLIRTFGGEIEAEVVQEKAMALK